MRVCKVEEREIKNRVGEVIKYRGEFFTVRSYDQFSMRYTLTNRNGKSFESYPWTV